MWAAAVSLPSAAVSNSLTVLCNRRTPTLRASFSDYPLASKIMVRNLPYSTSENMLEKEFSAFGEIAKVKLIKDDLKKRSKGCAFIQYTCKDAAMLALECMDQKVYNGRVIYIDVAKPEKHDFRGLPRTSGPPSKPAADDEVADCWY